MGLLDALKQYVADSMPGGLLNSEFNSTNGQKLAVELQRGLLESTGINARDKRRAWNKNQLDAVSGSSDTRGSLNKDAYETAMNMAGMAPMGITAWHGSPHKFDKFSLDNIGTGQGAQAYGYGVYLAESPEVAKGYSEIGISPEPIGIPKKIWDHFYRYMTQTGELPKTYFDAQRVHSTDKWIGSESKKILEYEKKLTDMYESIKNGESIYKTDIPDEAVARFLDWDKPLSQQAPEARDAILKYLQVKNPELYRTSRPSAPAGSFVPRTGEQSSVEFSDALRKAGIPGLRYLDGESRSAGLGSSNFVVFDPEMIRILERNGQPTGQVPWASGEYRGFLGK